MEFYFSQLGREEPAMSMDSNGKIIFAKHSEISQANLKNLAGIKAWEMVIGGISPSTTDDRLLYELLPIIV